MSNPGTEDTYNYSTFSLEAHEGINSWSTSPPVGKPCPDHPLVALADGGETTLRGLCKEHKLLVAEFGSIT